MKQPLRSHRIRSAICCAIVPLGNDRRRFLAEELGDARLEPLDALAAAVDVQPRAGALGKRTKRLGRIARRRPRRDEALAARDDPLAFP